MDQLTNQIISILKKHRIPKASLFGSYARGDFTVQSDIDILYAPFPNMNLLDLAGIKIDLEESLGKKVDLVSERAIDEKLYDYIMQNVKLLYEER